MDLVTWPIAVGFVGSVATVCLTLLKLYTMRREDKKPAASNPAQLPCAEMQRRIAVSEAVLHDTREDLQRIESHLDKLNDTLIKLLTEK